MSTCKTLMRGEEVEMEGINVEVINSKGERLEAKPATDSSTGIDKGNKPLSSEKEGEVEVYLAVSHGSIVEGLKAAAGPGLRTIRGEKLASQRLKEKALKEVMNRLKAQLVKLKPDWVGPKGSGLGGRAVGLATNWVKHGSGPKLDGVVMRAQLDVNLRKGSLPSRPPDPTRNASYKEALAVPFPKSFEQNDPSAREKGGGEGGRGAKKF